MDYGTDFLLVDDDIVFTPDGDIELVSGSASVAQDIDQTLKTVLGKLPWDKEAGSSLPLVLNDAGSSASSVLAELERVAIADPRVDPASVKARETGSGTFRLEFTPLSAIKPEILDYDLTKGDSRE
jgi:phage baseplate assembly protein W